jgi:5-formyltetrahydrofolate cyclo-ligase
MRTEPSKKALKTQLREDIRHRRSSLDTAVRAKLDSAINRQIVERARLEKHAVVAAFMAFDGEPDLQPAMGQLEADGVVLALPVVQDSPGKSTIVFQQWESGCEMGSNRYGIAEPLGTGELHATTLDLVLVPLVAWDTAGGRLGMGASFYDRFFQPFVGQERPARVGVGYQIQQVEHIPLDPWDVRLHGVISESGFCTARNNG